MCCIQNNTLTDELNKEREELAKARQSLVQLNIELSRLQVINYCAINLLTHSLLIHFATVGYMCVHVAAAAQSRRETVGSVQL